MDKNREPSCCINLAALSDVAVGPTDVLDSVQSLADRACLVPVEP